MRSQSKKAPKRGETAPPARGKTPPLRFDFRKAARKAAQDHPELRKNILFINAANDDRLAAPRVLERLEEDDDAQEEIDKTVRLAKRLRTSFFQAVALDSKNDIRTVVFHPDRHTLYDPADREIDAAGSFDHETGHALAPDAHGTLGENTADAYALLRHAQRFDGMETQAGFAAWKRAVIFMQTGITSHLTTFTIDKILIDRKTADFVSLTPRETAAVARDYARKNTPGAKRLKSLSQAFQPLKDKPLNDATFRKLAKITLSAPAGSDVFYIGARILLPPLEHGPMRVDGKKVVLTGREWEKIRDRLEGKIATLPPAHPLRRRPGSAHHDTGAPARATSRKPG